MPSLTQGSVTRERLTNGLLILSRVLVLCLCDQGTCPRDRDSAVSGSAFILTDILGEWVDKAFEFTDENLDLMTCGAFWNDSGELRRLPGSGENTEGKRSLSLISPKLYPGRTLSHQRNGPANRTGGGKRK